MTDIRYPIGKFESKNNVSTDDRRECIRHIAEAPAKLRAAVRNLTNEQMNTPYRPNGWTVKQVVHHVADSHLNAYVRFKLAMTEQEPTIKTYAENLWAELPDARNAPVETSLQLLESLHQRWILLLESFTPADFSRTFRHPDRGIMTLEQLLQLYSWHGRHHVAHITSLKERMSW
jgi:uncharacterized damage-inducible protein DinB